MRGEENANVHVSNAVASHWAVLSGGRICLWLSSSWVHRLSVAPPCFSVIVNSIQWQFNGTVNISCTCLFPRVLNECVHCVMAEISYKVENVFKI